MALVAIQRSKISVGPREVRIRLDGFVSLSKPFIIAVRVHETLTEVVIKFQVQRIECDGTTQMHNGLIGTADPGEFQAEPMMTAKGQR